MDSLYLLCDVVIGVTQLCIVFVESYWEGVLNEQYQVVLVIVGHNG